MLDCADVCDFVVSITSMWILPTSSLPQRHRLTFKKEQQSLRATRRLCQTHVKRFVIHFTLTGRSFCYVIHATFNFHNCERPCLLAAVPLSAPRTLPISSCRLGWAGDNSDYHFASSPATQAGKKTSSVESTAVPGGGKKGNLKAEDEHLSGGSNIVLPYTMSCHLLPCCCFQIVFLSCN